MTMSSQFADMTSSSSFFDVLFFLSSLATGPSFMSISSLVLELWQFFFIRDWPEIRKSDITPSEFCPMSGDRGESGIPNLARMLLTKCYRMLQNARVTAFTASELLKENQQRWQNYTRQKEIHFKEVRLSFSSIWKLISHWFDKHFLEAVTDWHIFQNSGFIWRYNSSEK